VTDRGTETDRQTDRQMDGRTDVSKERAIAYMLSRAKNWKKCPGINPQKMKTYLK